MKRLLIFSILIFVGSVSCTKDIGKKPIEKIECVPPTVSFNQNIIPLFNQYCNTSGCHAGNLPAGNLNLEAGLAYSELKKTGKGYIDTITPNFSLLYAQMISTTEPMPPTGKLDDCKLELILKWIQQKAKNN